MLWDMAKPKLWVQMLPTSPVTLACPRCKAKPGHDCVMLSGKAPLVHVARIKAAAAPWTKQEKVDQ
jgi:hypothetical protein